MVVIGEMERDNRPITNFLPEVVQVQLTCIERTWIDSTWGSDPNSLEVKKSWLIYYEVYIQFRKSKK